MEEGRTRTVLYMLKLGVVSDAPVWPECWETDIINPRQKVTILYNSGTIGRKVLISKCAVGAREAANRRRSGFEGPGLESGVRACRLVEGVLNRNGMQIPRTGMRNYLRVF